MNREEFVARLLLAGYVSIDWERQHRYAKGNTLVVCYVGIDNADIYTRPGPEALWRREFPDQPMDVAAKQLGLR